MDCWLRLRRACLADRLADGEGPRARRPRQGRAFPPSVDAVRARARAGGRPGAAWPADGGRPAGGRGVGGGGGAAAGGGDDEEPGARGAVVRRSCNVGVTLVRR
eukprot:1175689-Prorocentrum_minimum.AAC.3